MTHRETQVGQIDIIHELLLDEAAIAEQVIKMKEERNAVILVHNYQRPEVQDIADFTGDSLGLSREAARTEAEVIVFCGVHFMAETAFILSPDKTVLLPEMRAGCPMADMADAADVARARDENPDAMVVSYVNTSAAVKAVSDYCCTSANAVQVTRAVASDRVLFVPDKNLAAYVASQVDKEIIAWGGFCPTHENITAQHIELAKIEHPLANAAPEKSFFSPAAEPLCPNMKLTTLSKVLWALQTLEPRVTVPEEIRVRALGAVERMLALG
jgi:quinolinate synthase